MTQTASQPQVDYEPTLFTACPGCFSLASDVWADTDRYGLQVDTLLCRTCGCVYINPTWTEEEYADFYASGKYRELVAWRTGKEHDQQALIKAQEAYSQVVCERIMRGVLRRDDRTLLDYGGSTGIFAAMARDTFKLECTVVDPATAELDNASDLGLQTSPNLADLPQRPFDVITILQTIEHLLSPRVVLTQLRREYSHDRTLLIVDCVEFYALAKHLGRRVATKIDHPCNFTVGALGAMLSHCGWAPINAFAFRVPQLKVWLVCEPGVNAYDLREIK